MREDLLAPVIPGREPDDGVEPNEEPSALDVQDLPNPSLEATTVRRRLVVDRSDRATLRGQRSTVTRRDDRQHLEDTAELDTAAQG